MSNLNKRTYTKKNSELEAELAYVMEVLTEALETNGESLNKIEDWNEYHDLETQIRKEIKSLERAYSRRNWDEADYITRELIVNNCD